MLISVERRARCGYSRSPTATSPGQHGRQRPDVSGVRFSGYDGALEAPFFIGERALKQIQPDMPFNESGLLKAFDLNRGRIYATATKVYERGRKGSYDVLPEDF
jgi:hypothetical protein